MKIRYLALILAPLFSTAALAAGYTGPGEYLLLLEPEPGARLDGHPAFAVVGQQRSPGADLEGVGPPAIYKWGPDVRAQAKRLFP